MDRRDCIRSMLVSAAAPLVTAPRTALAQSAGASNSAPLLLEYTRAASRWVEALPIGNGRLGAMVFGDVDVERLQLNDDTLWSGGPGDRSPRRQGGARGGARPCWTATTSTPTPPRRG